MSQAWAAILIAGIGTYALRASFLAFAHRLVDLPPLVTRVLRQIPPAVLAALVVPALLRPEGAPLAAPAAGGDRRRGGQLAHPQHRIDARGRDDRAGRPPAAHVSDDAPSCNARCQLGRMGR